MERRYSDFEWLQDQLRATYKGYIIPPLPEKSIAGTGEVQSSFTLSKIQENFIDKRRLSLQRFLRRCVAHTTLAESSDLMNFLQVRPP